MSQTLKGFVKMESTKHLYILEISLLNPQSYVEIYFAFLLFINTIFFLEIKSAIHIFLQKDFIETYFIVPSILFQQNTGTKHCEPILGKRGTANNIQQRVTLSWLVTQTVIHDANVADEKGLPVCLNELSWFPALNYLKLLFAPGGRYKSHQEISLLPLPSFPLVIILAGPFQKKKGNRFFN